jgi:hypothetical protein
MKYYSKLDEMGQAPHTHYMKELVSRNVRTNMGLMTAFEAMINAYTAIDAGGAVPAVAPWRTCLIDCSTRILLIPDFDVITKANVVDRIGVNATEVKKNEGKKGKKNRNVKSTFCSRCGRSNHDLGGC